MKSRQSNARRSNLNRRTLEANYVVAGSVSGDRPGEIGIDRRNNNDSTGPVSAFITASGLIDPVTLRASGPCHWCHA